MPYPNEAVWQDVLRKPAGKLLIPQGHGPGLAAITVVLIPKSDFAFGYLFNAVVADRYLVGITSQIFDHLFRSAERSLCIDNPILRKQTIQKWLVGNAMHP